MTEDEAKSWVRARFGERATERLARFADLVERENGEQNLVAPSTLPSIWSRHIVDSAQLIEGAPPGGRWIDIGTGGGFPGFVVALLRPAPIVLVEPRRRRAAFLERCVGLFDLPSVSVRASRIERVMEVADVISARAVAPAARLFADAHHCARRDTLWLLPRGRDTLAQVAAVEQHWRGVFHVKQSVTDPNSGILTASDVRPR